MHAPALAVLLFAAGATTVVAQSAGGPAFLRVYLDCQTHGCDFNYFRTAIDWVDWMRDPQDADVHILVTSQSTGSGGRAYTLDFIGRGPFAGRADTLHYEVPPKTTADERRQGLSHEIRLGLVPYAAETPVGEQLKVTLPAGAVSASAAGATSPERDPWDHWVFELSTDTHVNGESSQNSFNVSGNVTARRVTALWKLYLTLGDSYDQSKYTLSDGTTVAIQRHYGFSGLAVRSLGDHISAGLRGGVSSDTYSNEKLSTRIGPAVEYDLFPYSESTRRQFTLMYGLGYNYFDYDQPTLYGKLQDRLLDQRLTVGLELRQPWGSVSTSVEASQYLNWTPGHNAPPNLTGAAGAKYRASIYGGLSFRVARGLSFRVHGAYSRVHDQVGLPAESASDQEILLQLRQLQTSYTYYTSVGLSYTFGSIYNNIVNPRFSSSN